MGDVIKLNIADELPQNSFEKLADEIPNMEGIDALVALLQMPDEDFEHLKPLVLEELEKNLNNSNDKYSLAFALSSSGISVETLRSKFSEVMEKIDEEFSMYNDSKKDFLKQTLSFMLNALEKGRGLHSRIVKIPIELCNEDARIPSYANDGDAGCDVYALEDITVEPNSTVLVPLGFKVAIPHGYELQIRPRSGMSLRTKIRIANSPATIDSGYRGEVGVIIDNIDTERPYYITKGQRIAQMVLSEVPVASFFTVNNIDEYASARGKGGYGSSGR